MLGLQYFDFQTVWHPASIAFFILLAAIYLLLTGPLRSKIEHSEPVSFNKKAWFMLGLVLYYFAEGGPLMLLGHLMFSAHMLHMAVAYLIAPPMILTGIPAWLMRPVLRPRYVRPLFRFLIHPIVAVLLFSVLFSFYHMPDIMDAVMSRPSVAPWYDFLLLFSAFLLWWPIVAPLPEYENMSDVQKMAYVFAASVLLTPACALITFAGQPIYQVFSDPASWAQMLEHHVSGSSSAQLLQQFKGPQFFAPLSILEDQQLGGVLMKLVQEIMDGWILGYAFFRWYRRENPVGQQIDPIPQE